MADELDPAAIAEIEDIQDDILLNEGLLESLKEVDHSDDSDTEATRRLVRKNLHVLQKRLRALQPRLDDDGGDVDAPTDREARQRAPLRTHRSDSRPGDPSEGATRKRPHPDSGLEIGSASKSRRTTPSSATTAAPSPADSTGSFDSLELDDPLLNPLLGTKSPAEPRLNRELWSRHEQRKKQEEEDAKLALRLSQEWSQSDELSAPPPRSAPPMPPSESTQAFFRADGSLNRRTVVDLPANDGRASSPVKVEPELASRNLATIKTEQPSSSVPGLRLSSTSTPSLNRIKSEFPPSISAPSLHRIKPELPSYPPRVAGMLGSYPGAEHNTSLGAASAWYNTARSTVSAGALPGPSQPRPASLSYVSTLPGLTDGRPLAYGQAGLPPPFYDPLSPMADAYSDPAQTKEEIAHLLKHIRPDEDLAADQALAQPQGLKATLMPHQLAGVAWMKSMEEGTNKGGILADDMGLGKTIQCIALMLERPPPPDQHRPTLIVAPVALMQQWKREMERMVRSRHRFNVFILHGDTRKATWAALKAYDVVLTTYGTLTSELKRKVDWEDKLKRFPDARPSTTEECSLLGERSRFHRLILDEAQNIKNRNAKASLAACRLSAEYRWALTGTPMQNNVEEMFSLIRFCRIRPYNEWSQFRRDISGPLKSRHSTDKDRSMRTLQALLRAILLRRTKQSEIDGKPILQLPPKTTQEERVAFEQDEMDFYRSLESKAQIQFNKYLRRGGIGRNYSQALVLLLRLRQACCHPYLVVNSHDFIQAANLDTDTLLANAAALDASVVARLKDVDMFECPICFDADENPSLFPCGHSLCNECVSRLLEASTNDNDGENAPTCPHCRAKLDSNKITDITSFLRVHCPDRAPQEEGDESGADSDSSRDSADDSDDSDDDDLDGFIVPDDLEEGDGGKAVKGKEKKPRKHKAPKSKNYKPRSRRTVPDYKSLATLRKEALRSKTAKRAYLRRLRRNFEPSTKITKTIQLLEEIRGRGNNEKTIIFSNFTSFLDLLEVPLHDHENLFNYARYDGSMSAAARNDAVMEFTDNPYCTVILVSLKAGNAGLNLTAANHVVMLDPFWNPFVEYQAADRCYRIGQQREVTVHRILIGEPGEENRKTTGEGSTVEDRILALQERKRELVETALDESAGRSLARLGERELGYLFGLNDL